MAKLGILSGYDLLHHYPFRYLDFSKITKINQVKVGEETTVIGRVKEIKKSSVRPGLKLLKIGIFDETGYIFAVWFNQDYIAQKLKVETWVALSGRVEKKYGLLQMQNPFYDQIEDEFMERGGTNTASIVPVHPATAEISSSRMRRLIRNFFNQVDPLSEYLPADLLAQYDLKGIDFALKEIHFPKENSTLQKAKKRLLFDEMLLLQLALLIKKGHLKDDPQGVAHRVPSGFLNEFSSKLPFELTSDQLCAIAEIRRDMEDSTSMNRLLQGEVGSGKTIVALAALSMSVKGKRQGALMAPTEVLAKQHFKKASPVLEAMNFSSGLLTGSTPKKEREALLSGVKEGRVDIVFGTHALIQEGVDFKKLGLIVVDEQHRFGVEQRLALKEKGDQPDVLIMTATPIPRSLSLTLYGDLDISTIKERPKGNDLATHVKTYIVSERQRFKAYEKISQEVKKGRQAYVICPLIEESDKLALKSVTEEVKKLENEIFSEFRVGVIHGKMKSQEKDSIMTKFQNGNIDILISTTVIEVGIDVPNATIILIEDADRFGLSQLHQLRGRIGRGSEKSYCILFSKLDTDEAKARMRAIRDISDGFSLAEQDLIIRGQGEIFGHRQSGRSDLKLIRLPQDFELLKKARAEAESILKDDSTLISPKNLALLEVLTHKYQSGLFLNLTG